MARNITIQNFDDRQILEINEHAQKIEMSFDSALFYIVQLGLHAAVELEIAEAGGIDAVIASEAPASKSLLERARLFLGLGVAPIAPIAPIAPAAPDAPDASAPV